MTVQLFRLMEIKQTQLRYVFTECLENINIPRVDLFSLDNEKTLTVKYPGRERERVYLLEKNTQHNKTVKILRAGCQKGHSPSCWPPMIHNVLHLTHTYIEGT